MINSGSKVSELRHKINEKSADLTRNQNKASRLEELNTSGNRLKEIRDSRAAALKQLEDQANCLATLTSKGLPGIPANGEAGDKAAELAQELAIRAGETDPLIPLPTIAKLSCEGARKVEEYFESKQVSGYRSDRISIVHNPAASWANKNTRLFPATKAITLLNDSHQLFKDDADRVNKLEELQEAVDCFLDQDTNPFRESYLADKAFLETLQEEVKELKEKRSKLETLREELESRDKEFADNETVYTDALKEGLFTEEELSVPDTTEADVQTRLKAINDSYNRFLETIGRFKPMAEPWGTFQRNHGQHLTPDELLQEKDQQHAEIKEQQAEHSEQKTRQQAKERELNAQLHAIGQQLPKLEAELNQLNLLNNAYQQVSTAFPDEDIQGLVSRLEHKLQVLREEQQALSESYAASNKSLADLQALKPGFDDFQKVFPNQEPQGLEDKLWNEKGELDQQSHQLEAQIRQLEVLVSDLRQFQEQFPDTTPAEWLDTARSLYPALLTSQSALGTAINDLTRQLEDLERDPVSPSATENSAAELLKTKGLSFRPLYQVITETLSDDDVRKPVWLAQAHNLLFAPVIASENEALQAAEIFAHQRQPVPVFTETSLKQAAKNSETGLLGAVVGYESLAVKSLLNPEFLAELKQQLQDDLSRHQQQLIDVEQSLTIYDPRSDAHALATSAAQAVNQNAEEELSLQQAALATSQERLIEINNQLAPENRQLIRSAERFLELGGEQEIKQLTETVHQTFLKLDSLNNQLSQLHEQLSGENRRLLDQAEQFLNSGGDEKLHKLNSDVELLTLKQDQISEEHEQCLATLESFEQLIQTCQNQLNQIYSAGEREQLINLDRYLQDGGPEFMAKADQTRASLEAQRTQTQNRASVKFDRIRAYLNARDQLSDTAALKKQIAEIKSNLKTTDAEKDEKESEINRIRDEQPQQLQAISQIDETASRWLKQLAHFSSSMLAELPEPDLDRLESMPLFEKAEAYQAACNSDDIDRERICDLSMSVADQLEQENIKELSKELGRQNQTHDEREGQFRNVLERIQTQDRHLFNATDQVRLAGFSKANADALSDLASMITMLTDNIAENAHRLEELQDSMSNLEDKLQERLTSIILHSVDNLRILRRVVSSSSGDNAFFVIDADTVSEEGVRNLVRSLLAEIEENQKLIRSRKAQNLAVGSEEKQKKDLSENLRSQIYRQLFTNISIRLKHTAIRPHGKLFSLNESMSEGQREAVSLMWLVKLSEFAIERELKSVPSQYRRKERKSSESVIILDGLFSKLSHKKLIEDSLESLRNTRGRFQMVGLIHNPNYENDPGIFPTYLVGNVIGGLQGQGGHVTVKQGVKVSPVELGLGSGEASLFHLHVDNRVTDS